MDSSGPSGVASGVGSAGGTVGAAATEHERDLLTLLVRATSDYAIFALDADGRVATWNTGAQRLTGYSAEEIIGSHVSRFYPAEAVAAGRPERELAIAVADGHAEEEGWWLRSDGTPFWADVVITALRGPDGRLVGFGEVTRDLTERRRGEEVLRDSEERFRLLVNSVADYAIFLLDPEGRIASWNLGAERLKGYRADEILGRHFSSFYTHDDLRADIPGTALRTALAAGRFENEGWRVRKDGSRFWANVVITALHAADGTHRGFAKVTKDLTERKRNEDALRGVLEREREAAARLRELDRMRSELVGLVAHDLRAPLTVIQNLTHVIREDWDALSESEKLGYVERIDARADAMAELVDDVADVARIDARQLSVEHVAFDVGEVVEHAVNDVVALPAMRTVVTEIEPGACALGDRRRTWQVISNLLSNAVKFSPPEAPIEVTVARQGAEIVVSVCDHGRGIAPEQHDVVFERFTRLAPSAGSPGTGAGLYIAKGFVEAQHGRMWVSSQLGQGATFSFALPAS